MEFMVFGHRNASLDTEVSRIPSILFSSSHCCTRIHLIDKIGVSDVEFLFTIPESAFSLSSNG